MGNTTDKGFTDLITSKTKKPIFMAYTLNNHQPVQCTMISDQPYFYMDEEIPVDEDAVLSDEMFQEFDMESLDAVEPTLLEEELLGLKNKIDAYERVSLDFAKGEDERHRQFLMDGHFISHAQPKMERAEIIDQIKKRLSASHYARGLLAFAIDNEIELSLSNQVETSSYDKKAGKIFIRENIDLIDQVLLTVQELRRHWQHRQGALVHPLTFHPDQAVLINRAQLADLSVAVVRVAWDLKLAGQNDVWARIENSSLSDLGRAHAREALGDFRTLNNGKAASAVFETWFLSERCRAHDKKIIQAMLADYRGYVFSNAEASRMISIDLICALGEQPMMEGQMGKNYLAPYAQMILNDALFTDVRDRANANFLWFIKFEREFTHAEEKAEQELQTSNIIKTSDGSDQATHNDIIEDTQHDAEFTRNQKQTLRDRLFTSPQRQGDDNVIHVQFGANKQCDRVSP